MELPYLTPDFPGLAASVERRPKTLVQEIPLYEPTGEGEHVYAEIQKVGLTTFEAINRVSHALNVSPRDIGYAGMKDAQAVTVQTLSILGTTPSWGFVTWLRIAQTEGEPVGGTAPRPDEVRA